MNQLYKLKTSDRRTLKGGSVMTVNMVKATGNERTALFVRDGFGWRRVK